MLPGPATAIVDTLLTAKLILFALGLAVLVLFDARTAATLRLLANVLR
ncbi:hypothetical protein [Microcystis phage MJing1]|nr:hypothetical protein [Microcystis phage MJing1]